LKSQQRKNDDNSKPFWFAIGLTAVVIVLGGWTFYEKEVWCLKGNEIGDFFAGFAGALAFIWIVATIFLQKDELKFQREELELQRKEVKRLADETALQGKALNANAKTFFVDRWENGLIAFARVNHEHLANLEKQLVKEKLLSKEIETDILAKAAHRFRKSTIDSVLKVEDTKITNFRVVDHHNIEYTIEGTSTVAVVENSAEKTIKIDPRYQISNLELHKKLQDQPIYMDYIRDLVSEGVSLGLASMMKSSDVWLISTSRLPHALATDIAQLTKCIISFMIRDALDFASQQAIEKAISE